MRKLFSMPLVSTLLLGLVVFGVCGLVVSTGTANIDKTRVSKVKLEKDDEKLTKKWLEESGFLNVEFTHKSHILPALGCPGNANFRFAAHAKTDKGTYLVCRGNDKFYFYTTVTKLIVWDKTKRIKP